MVVKCTWERWSDFINWVKMQFYQIVMEELRSQDRLDLSLDGGFGIGTSLFFLTLIVLHAVHLESEEAFQMNCKFITEIFIADIRLVLVVLKIFYSLNVYDASPSIVSPERKLTFPLRRKLQICFSVSWMRATLCFSELLSLFSLFEAKKGTISWFQIKLWWMQFLWVFHRSSILKTRSYPDFFIFDRFEILEIEEGRIQSEDNFDHLFNWKSYKRIIKWYSFSKLFPGEYWLMCALLYSYKIKKTALMLWNRHKLGLCTSTVSKAWSRKNIQSSLKAILTAWDLMLWLLRDLLWCKVVVSAVSAYLIMFQDLRV